MYGNLIRIVVIIGILVGMVGGSYPGYSSPIYGIEGIEGMKAPDIVFTDKSGKILHLKDFKGKTVILSFWATWCAPCLLELPTMDRLQARMGNSISILPVALEPNGSAMVERFFSKADIKHLPIYIDSGHQAQSVYHIRALPMTVVIDPAGMLVGKIEGAMDWDKPEIQKYLENL
jgi:thiol-disulfide isomerase/thioredoxin